MANKTQILITDVPKERFSSSWPQNLEKILFEEKFPHLKPKVQYYTPLAFLNRIVIILDDEKTTLDIYNYLKEHENIKNSPMKLFITENLLKPRSKSSSNANDGVGLDSDKELQPILSLDTNPLHTGIESSSLSLGSSALSPDSGLDSPTLLKISDETDSKPYMYREPLPCSKSVSEISTTRSLSVESDNNQVPKSPSIRVHDFTS
ncbi:hypothetical protein Kpol_1059p28 [Vanderwaltozyma polyspora DSM 70294]|uniref:Uncharacterized protein n=1 Tax=Vanderwaltozyma polyspora (strain ATCC 22028 / DSM 70294 / BCRC 21397 / CBS 2163 / NBRC 10782 / NRRL Y-8283 / UCD 57-17) TaxID=436907 RepID=A7TN32_VANPO|nr:uncharacterized protein Kpol_1059p28 [Vanderwaltozyma polyspora DSM 70294]EDO16338.1 hypothetical protein Kpol_1059p28 [Vanderwaltozyma polyspora DSM 70294]